MANSVAKWHNLSTLKRQLDEEYKDLVYFFTKKGYKPLGNGRHRIGLQSPSGKYIIKLPINILGEKANINEAQIYSGDIKAFGKDNVHKAKCRLFKYNGFPCLIIEKLRVPDADEDLPEWVWAYDGAQVGYTRKNKLVAWDYTRGVW